LYLEFTKIFGQGNEKKLVVSDKFPEYHQERSKIYSMEMLIFGIEFKTGI
jgi:hypothetical protein